MEELRITQDELMNYHDQLHKKIQKRANELSLLITEMNELLNENLYYVNKDLGENFDHKLVELKFQYLIVKNEKYYKEKLINVRNFKPTDKQKIIVHH